MRIWYSASTGGFYVQGVHRVAPDDAVEITEKQHRALLDAQSKGQMIAPDAKGCPQAVAPPLPPADEQAALARGRRDRMLRESDAWVLPDFPIPPDQRNAVYRYRDALRRLPEQAGFPQRVQWPRSPIVSNAAG